MEEEKREMNLKKHNNLKLYIKLVIISIVFLVGIWFVSKAYDLSEHMPFLSYEFEFRAQGNGDKTPPSLEIENIDLTYNFETNKGEIEIFFLGVDIVTRPIGELKLEIPGNVKNDSLRLSIYKNSWEKIFVEEIFPERKFEIETYTYNNNYAEIRFEKFPRNLVNDEYLVLSFESDIKPKGEYAFQVYSDHGEILDYIDIFFELGKKYICDRDCLDKPHGFKQTKGGEKGYTNTLNLLSYKNHSPSFEINTLDRGSAQTKDLYNTIGITLLISTMVILIQEFFNLLNR